MYPTAKVSEQVNRKWPSWNKILQLSTHTPTLSHQALHLLNHRRWCHLANTLKHTVNKRTAKISTSGIAIVSMLHGYSRQRRTTGSFLATAGILVMVEFVSLCIADAVFGCGIWNFLDNDILVRTPCRSKNYNNIHSLLLF